MDLLQIWYSVKEGDFAPRLRMRRMNTLVTRSTNWCWLPLRLYTDVRKIPDFTKKAHVSWMCFIILNDLYTTHHNSLYIISSKSVICMRILISRPSVWDRKLICLRFRGKAHPLRRNTVFEVARIPVMIMKKKIFFKIMNRILTHFSALTSASLHSGQITIFCLRPSCEPITLAAMEAALHENRKTFCMLLLKYVYQLTQMHL